MTKLKYATYREIKRTKPHTKQSRFGLFITRKVEHSILETVGKNPPEAGAFLFGPKELQGSDLLAFDEEGTRQADSSSYSPDHRWATAQMEKHMDAPDESIRLLSGLAHSHPGSYGEPSPKVARATGDLGYAEAFFNSVEWMQYLNMPILTGCGTNQPKLWSWIVSRDNPFEPMFSAVKVCQSEREFPKRVFNSEWEARCSPKHEGMVDISQFGQSELYPLIPLDLREVAEFNRAKVEALSNEFKFTRNGISAYLTLPSRFPRSAPKLYIETETRSNTHARLIRQPFPFRWKRNSKMRIEIRLSYLVRAALIHGQTNF